MKLLRVKSRILILICIFTLSITTTLSNAQSTATNKVKISEYDMINIKNNNELLSMGYSEKQVNEIVKEQENLVNKIKMLSVYNANTLKEMGYSPKQIRGLKSMMKTSFDTIISFDYISSSKSNSADQQAFLAYAATRGVFGDVNMNSLYLGVVNDKHAFSINWSWDGRPLLALTDGIGVAWDNGFRVQQEDIDLVINYAEGISNASKRIPMSNIETVPGTGFTAKLPMLNKISSSIGGASWGKSGFVNWTVTNPQNKSDIQMAFKYGHRTVAIGGIGISIKGTPSISFGFGTQTMFFGDETYTLDK